MCWIGRGNGGRLRGRMGGLGVRLVYFFFSTPLSVVLAFTDTLFDSRTVELSQSYRVVLGPVFLSFFPFFPQRVFAPFSGHCR